MMMLIIQLIIINTHIQSTDSMFAMTFITRSKMMLHLSKIFVVFTMTTHVLLTPGLMQARILGGGRWGAHPRVSKGRQKRKGGKRGGKEEKEKIFLS